MTEGARDTTRAPVSVLVPTLDEGPNLSRCLGALRGWAGEVVVVDSGSTDATLEIARAHDATILQFEYRGGWPKKRQWALEQHDWKHHWILLLDADEVLTEPLKAEIGEALERPGIDGYWLRFRMVFLGRELRWGDSELRKLSLFRRGRGRYERRLETQDRRMSDVEVHEHVVVDGPTAILRHPVRHENRSSLHRYIEKHNAYSSWEAAVLMRGEPTEIRPRLFGNQAERRRWLKGRGLHLPGSPLLRFLWVYLLRGGFLDGRAGLVWATFKLVQTFHVKAKLLELRSGRARRS